jgi:hypothetical protein
MTSLNINMMSIFIHKTMIDCKYFLCKIFCEIYKEL